MLEYPSDVAFTQTVKELQAQKGSRASYAQMERGSGWNTQVNDRLRAFLESADMFYFGSANATGQPYIQYRGGPKGFLKVLDDSTLAFADFAGNRQYISAGNLQENPKAFIFLMDYVLRRRIKIWGRARFVDNDAKLLEQLSDPSYPARPERALVFEITAWDGNCPQHIHRRIPEREAQAIIDDLQEQIKSLTARLAAVKQPSGLDAGHGGVSATTINPG